MNNCESLNLVFPDPRIRENRIRLIARNFSDKLSSMYNNHINEIMYMIEVARQKGSIEEVLRLTKESTIDRYSYLHSIGGTKKVFESILWDYEDYYGYNFPGKDYKEIRKIFDSFWSLAEEAVPFINRREQLLIDVSEDNDKTWLNSFQLEHKRPISAYSYEVLLKLIKTDIFGIPELDDLGFEQSIDPWFAYSVVSALLFDQLRLFESYDYYYTIISGSYALQRSCEEAIAEAKKRLSEATNHFPWVDQLIPTRDNCQSKKHKLIADDKQFVAFLSGIKKFSKLSTWLHNLLSLEKPYLQETKVIYNNDGTINKDYLEEGVMPIINQLKNRIDGIPRNDDYEYELGRFLLEDANSCDCYMVLLQEVLNAIGITDFDNSVLSHFVRSRQKCDVPVLLDKVVTILEQTINSILVSARTRSDGTSARKLSGIELVKVFQDLFIILDEATKTYAIKPRDYYQDPLSFIRTQYGKSMQWGDVTLLGSYETHDGELVDKNYYFVVSNEYLENGVRYYFKLEHGLVQGDLANVIKLGVKPKAEDLVVKTVINEQGEYNYTLMYKGNNKSISDGLEHYLFFDTETTGLPLDPKAPSSEIENWPRLVQLSWIITDEKGVKIKEANRIIKPSGFIIPKSSEKLHGISTEKAIKIGRDINEVLSEFTYDIYNRVRFIVGHNVQFDKKIIGAELIRLGKRDDVGCKTDVDTMKISCHYCKIPGGKDRYKYPSLQELHKILFGCPFDNEHDASSDVAATEKCFWELIRLGVFDVEKYFMPF